LGTDFNISFVIVPNDALVHPLWVIPDCGGDTDTYFVVLPKHNWSKFFEERIITANNTKVLVMCEQEHKYTGASKQLFGSFQEQKYTGASD
jgi:hypothetical protein